MTNQALVSRFATLCPTSALHLDATSSARGFKTSTTGLGSTKGVDSSEGKVKDGSLAGVCRLSEGYISQGSVKWEGRKDWETLVKGIRNEEDLMVLRDLVGRREKCGVDLQDILHLGMVVGVA